MSWAISSQYYPVIVQLKGLQRFLLLWTYLGTGTAMREEPGVPTHSVV